MEEDTDPGKKRVASSDDCEEAVARQAGLVHVEDTDPGISRHARGSGFFYRDSDGRVLKDEAVLARIKAIAIPPAYVGVWICANPRGHLQATGRDARGRKQYRYHPRWRLVRDSGKFERLVAFGQALPKLRRALRRDLALPGLPQEKVVAAVISLLDQTLIRVGNEEYARTNGSFGLTTLRNKHLQRRGGRMTFRFRGKSGKEHSVALGDARLSRIALRCQQLPGQLLFQYLDADGAPHPVDSGMVNDYLRQATGSDFTAKDFRTWGGTIRATALLAATPLTDDDGEPASESFLARLENAAVTEVARLLGNTAAVCRKSYIHPEVFQAWRDGRLAQMLPNPVSLATLERRALSLLKRSMRRTQKP